MVDNLIIENCQLPGIPGTRYRIVIEDGLIGDIVESTSTNCDVDAMGGFVLPGFIDVHIQGAGGSDVLDGTPGDLEKISRTCAMFGTTGFLATTVYRPGGENEHLKLLSRIDGGSLGGAKMLGIHLEGPFLSINKRGMIQLDCICPTDAGIMEDLIEVCGSRLRMMTIAPELEGGKEIIEFLVENGVIASFGHSSATYDQTRKGISAGLGQVTHVFNAMPGLHHRSPGPILAILEADDLPIQVITDGIHIHPGMLRWVFHQFGGNRFITITDGMCAMGLPEGNYVYNGLDYEAKGGAARYSDGTLIGTTLGMSEMVGRLMGITGCGLEVASRTASFNPSLSLGLGDRKGSIRIGNDADIVVLGEDLEVECTIVGGRVVYRKPK
jgi:N-acetylglucosamine-6-phosphate deacetylase